MLNVHLNQAKGFAERIRGAFPSSSKLRCHLSQMCEGLKSPKMGNGHPTCNDGNPYNGYIRPYKIRLIFPSLTGKQWGVDRPQHIIWNIHKPFRPFGRGPTTRSLGDNNDHHSCSNYLRYLGPDPPSRVWWISFSLSDMGLLPRRLSIFMPGTKAFGCCRCPAIVVSAFSTYLGVFLFLFFS